MLSNRKAKKLETFFNEIRELAEDISIKNRKLSLLDIKVIYYSLLLELS